MCCAIVEVHGPLRSKFVSWTVVLDFDVFGGNVDAEHLGLGISVDGL